MKQKPKVLIYYDLFVQPISFDSEYILKSIFYHSSFSHKLSPSTQQNCTVTLATSPPSYLKSMTLLEHKIWCCLQYNRRCSLLKGIFSLLRAEILGTYLTTNLMFDNGFFIYSISLMSCLSILLILGESLYCTNITILSTLSCYHSMEI